MPTVTLSTITRHLSLVLSLLCALLFAGLYVWYYKPQIPQMLSLIHISEPTRLRRISYAGLCV